MNATNTARRNLLRFLAASPLVAAPSVASSIAALFASTPNEALAQSYDVLRGAARRRSSMRTGSSTCPPRR